MTSYYYSAPIKLGPGSVVMPGNWGRLVRRFAPNDQAGLMRIYREIALEMARAKFAPDMPSRLDCVFACLTGDEARQFRDKHQPANILHEIEPTEGSTPVHVSGYTLVDWPQPSTDALEPLVQRFQEYWTGEPKTDREALIGGSVRVIRSLVD